MNPMKLLALAASGCALIACAPMQSRQAQSPPSQASPNPWIRPVQTVRHGSDAEMLYRAGRVFQQQGRYEEAALAYKQALVASPTHVEAHNGLGVVQSLLGRAELAEREFRAAIELAPAESHLRNNLGYHLMKQGRVEEARAELEQGRGLDPANDVVATNLAAIQPPAAPLAMADVAVLPPVAPPAPPAPSEAPAPAAAQPAPPVASVVVPVEVKPAVAEAPAAPATFQGYRIELANGNGTAGLARRTSYLLGALGFEKARLTNDRPYGRVESRLQYVAGAEDAANAVNARLPAPLPLAQVPSLERSAKVRVLLGRDFPAKAPEILAAKPPKPRA